MKDKVKLIIVFVLGILISVLINVSAATVISAGEVSYTSNSNTTVQTGLDNLYTKANTIAKMETDYHDNIKFIKMSKYVTIPGNTTTNVTIGSTDCGTNYLYIGIINGFNGFGDQWLVTYGHYGSNIVAMVTSKWGSSLSETLHPIMICRKVNTYSVMQS